MDDLLAKSDIYFAHFNSFSFSMMSTHLWEKKEAAHKCGDRPCAPPSLCWWPRGLTEPHFCLPRGVDPNNVPPRISLTPEVTFFLCVLILAAGVLLGGFFQLLLKFLTKCCRRGDEQRQQQESRLRALERTWNSFIGHFRSAPPPAASNPTTQPTISALGRSLSAIPEHVEASFVRETHLPGTSQRLARARPASFHGNSMVDMTRISNPPFVEIPLNISAV